MANARKETFLEELRTRCGALRKLNKSQSLYEVENGSCLVYIRYSKVHARNSTFYGLRSEDLMLLEERPSLLCFLWQGQDQPVLVPFADFEDVFQSISPAGDGQYKAQIYIRDDVIELNIVGAGRFNMEAYVGWQGLDQLLDASKVSLIPDLSHTQVQTLLGSIGAVKGFDIYVPPNDRSKLDWSLTEIFDCRATLPFHLDVVHDILAEIDVMWIERGAGRLHALFEVEHSTPVYSGLLRFNDVLLVSPHLGARFSVVSNDKRRSLFTRQLNRPTFKVSRLAEYCTFMEYASVYSWYQRMRQSKVSY
jgi:hypothetical protein